MLSNTKPRFIKIFDILISCFGVEKKQFYDLGYIQKVQISIGKVSKIPIPHSHPNFQTFPFIIESYLITIYVHLKPVSLTSKASWTKKVTLSPLFCSICEFINTFLLWLRLLCLVTFIVSTDFIVISISTHFLLYNLVFLRRPHPLSMASFGSCNTQQ